MNLCLNHLKATARKDPGEVDAGLADSRADALDALLADERTRVRERLVRWRQLSPEQKQVLRERQQEFKSLSPEERQRLREEYRTRRDQGEAPPRPRAGQGPDAGPQRQPPAPQKAPPAR
jgi:hypothetical protein